MLRRLLSSTRVSKIGCVEVSDFSCSLSHKAQTMRVREYRILADPIHYSTRDGPIDRHTYLQRNRCMF